MNNTFSHVEGRNTRLYAVCSLNIYELRRDLHNIYRDHPRFSLSITDIPTHLLFAAIITFNKHLLGRNSLGTKTELI